VGTATGVGLADRGHRVRFVDIDSRRVAALSGQGHPAQTELRLSETEDDIVFLTVPTPHQGDRFDLGALESAARATGRALADCPSRPTIVLRSTVPPGTCDGVVRAVIESESGKRAGTDFLMASNPEFLRAASAEADFANPWMTVIASRSAEATDRLVELLAPLGGEMRTFDDPAIAELIKCAHNTFNATKISFWNEIWMVGSRLGINTDDVASVVAISAEGSFNPLYGIRGGAPFGGACLPKDTAGFLGFASELGLDLRLLRAVVAVNVEVADLLGSEIDSFPLQGASALGR